VTSILPSLSQWKQKVDEKMALEQDTLVHLLRTLLRVLSGDAEAVSYVRFPSRSSGSVRIVLQAASAGGSKRCVLLHGPPGVGKTALATLLADTSSLPWQFISCAGVFKESMKCHSSACALPAVAPYLPLTLLIPELVRVPLSLHIPAPVLVPVLYFSQVSKPQRRASARSSRKRSGPSHLS
jgi:hypothetical protein